ncbi:CIA30 family protein [uncultured Roseobacter sp.]|uniref:CIA30 family protein n=1 Tax=uncultured Roseobacter sp. TaxID=114847 RepID=UPI00345E0423
MIARAVMLACVWVATAFAEETHMELSPRWEYVADGVMGGVSTGQAVHMTVAGREAVRLTGEVSTENNGGFIQVAFDLRMDVSGWTGLEIDVIGNGERYDLRLRTDQMTRPWQSFRTSFVAPESWRSIKVPFATLEANKIDAQFDPARFRRVGVLAVGRAFSADLTIAGIRLFR